MTALLLNTTEATAMIVEWGFWFSRQVVGRARVPTNLLDGALDKTRLVGLYVEHARLRERLPQWRKHWPTWWRAA
jgi:hypothetical protein